MQEKKTFRVPRSRASETHQKLYAEISAALKPVLLNKDAEGQGARRQLESAFAAQVGAAYAVATHSGTLALFFALKACGIGPGDEVITVGNSDISTTGAIGQCGATPVLCDVLASDYTINPALVEAQLTQRSRALLPVDLHGHPSDVKALRALADKYQLKIVEDAALATGASDYGKPVGAFADVAIFSFAPFKPFGSAGNGAMLVTNDAAIAERLRLLVSYGGVHAPGGRQDYLLEGYNAPLDGLQAALLLVKLPYLTEWTAKRRAIAQALEAGLADSAAISPRFRPESTPTFRSYTIRVPDQQRAHQGLRAAGIEAVIHYAPPIYRYSVYAGKFPNQAQLPVTEKLASEIVNLPVTPELTAADVEYMIETVRKLV